MTQGTDLNWLLDELVTKVDEIHQVVLLSRDGLVMSASAGLTDTDARFLAALSSGYFSLANGAREHFEAQAVRQAVIEIDDKLFFVLPAGAGSCLAVLADAGRNTRMVAYETAMLIKRVRGHLVAAPRH
ncbi:roadblock/LC7 domain-containing protein [Actinocorallia aurea]